MRAVVTVVPIGSGLGIWLTSGRAILGRLAITGPVLVSGRRARGWAAAVSVEQHDEVFGSGEPAGGFGPALVNRIKIAVGFQDVGDPVDQCVQQDLITGIGLITNVRNPSSVSESQTRRSNFAALSRAWWRAGRR